MTILDVKQQHGHGVQPVPPSLAGRCTPLMTDCTCYILHFMTAAAMCHQPSVRLAVTHVILLAFLLLEEHEAYVAFAQSVDPSHQCVCIYVCVPQDESGPVWVQLLERCYAERSCPPKIVCSLAQQLAEQRALTEVHQYQIQEQQRQLAVQRRENVQQALQLQLQQDQLSAQQHAAAEQGSLVAELQGQLQVLQSQLQELLLQQKR